MEKQYVQHVSGKGKKWEVTDDHIHSQSSCWVVWNLDESIKRNTFHLPQSEYRLCEPPEVWRDITHECLAEKTCGTPFSQVLEDKQHVIAHIERGYRLKKVTLQAIEAHTLDRVKQTAFIVERREP